MKNGWIPIWPDGCGWQLWCDGQYLATVSVLKHRGGVAYVPGQSKRVRRFVNFQAAAAFVKGLSLV